MLLKPPACVGCVLHSKGDGYAPASGPQNADILLVGEALGEEEARAGAPFVGQAGGILNKLLERAGIEREAVRIDNTVRCRPPGNKLVGMPYEYAAINHCSPYLEATLAEPHKVTVALGATPTRRLLNQSKKKFSINNWHGCPTQDTAGRWIVPTFHPAFIGRGNQKLVGTMVWDLLRAKEVADGSYHQQPARVVVDPPVEAFRAWAALLLPDSWLAVDIETKEKLDGKAEDALEDESYQILRINFSYHPDEGVTVPWEGQYIEEVRGLLQRARTQVYWNARYDIPRLRANGANPGGTCLDFMWGWHLLQSDLPRALGFVAPFYSRYGAWKHLSGSSPGAYAATDAFQTLRCAFGIAAGLQASGQWGAYLRHVYELDRDVLGPAEAFGLAVDHVALEAFGEQLEEKEATLKGRLQASVGDDLRPLGPRGGLAKRPAEGQFVECLEQREVGRCQSCGAEGVQKRHRCKDKSLTPAVSAVLRTVSRYYRQLDFNPASSQQTLRLIGSLGLEAGKAQGQDGPSANKKAIEALWKQTGNPYFQDLLHYRSISKVRGTYVDGTRKRLGQDGRLHPSFLHKPSTLRLSCVNPNLQNVVSDRDGREGPASGFRACLVAAPGSLLVEADFAAIEAVETGWFSGDPGYIRLAKLGVHAYLASHLLGRPADLSWSDADLGAYFKEIKAASKPVYDMAKRCVHATNYGMTIFGMVNNYPDTFDRKSAGKTQGMYFELCPKLPAFQKAVRDRAHKDHYLGGNDHPYHYKHWFWDVYTYRNGKWTLGHDAKRCVAFYPQSTAAGVIKDAALRLMDRPDFASAFQGSTPIRALVHDSILCEVPSERLQDVLVALQEEMTTPVQEQPCPDAWNVGSHLKLGVAIKVGKNWLDMDEVQAESGVASDTMVREEEDEEDPA